METEKLRAVEEAVEVERKRGVEILVKERLAMEKEKRGMKLKEEKIGQDRAALDQQIIMFQQSQTRESDLINKLQVNNSPIKVS